MKLANCVPIELAFLHEAAMVPGIINSEKSLSSTKLPGIKMWKTSTFPNDLVLNYKNRWFFIPTTNVITATPPADFKFEVVEVA